MSPSRAQPENQPLADDTLPPLVRLRKWLARGFVLGISVSLLVHLIGILVATLIVTSSGGPPGPGTEGGEIEVAVVTQQELAELIAAALTSEVPNAEDLLAETNDLSTDLIEEPINTDFAIDGDLDTQIGLLGGDAGVDSAFGGGASGDGASFFGAEASGSRFAYIVDVSGSMASDNKLGFLIRELTRSVNTLGRESSFYVVTYSSEARPLGGRKAWTDANKRGTAWALKFIQRLQALGATRPAGAFEICLTLRPRPDAIFFMTDGEFGDAETRRILGLLAESDVPVHSITFGDQSAAAVMRLIANETGGTYTHVQGVP